MTLPTMLTSAQVREICGSCSDMSIHRWTKHGGFPKPVYHNRRRYWNESEVRDWWASRSEEAPPAPLRRETAQA